MMTNFSGRIFFVKDGIVRIHFLSSIANGQLVSIYDLNYSFKSQAIICTVDVEFSEGLLLSTDYIISEDFFVIPTDSQCVVYSNLNFFGNVYDSLGNNLTDSFDDFNHYTISSNIECRAPGIIDRKSVNEPLHTGIRVIDALIPIGRGQRELIIGDRQTGKSSLIFDMIYHMISDNIFNSENSYLELDDLKSNIWIIYVFIGHRKGRIARIWNEFLSLNISKFICLITAFSSDPAPMQFLAPYSGCCQGEFIRDIIQGHAVIFFNDLSKHAIAYRQMSLLLRRPAGREAYPGDIFYLHSRLLERSAKLSIELGGGSLTAFPVVETQAGDITAYIPTNVISITDGQIFLESSLFYKGIRPAINIGLSVSRVGSAAQTSSMKKIAGSLKLVLAQFREVEVFARLSVNLTNIATLNLIKRGRILTQIFVQKEREPSSLFFQLILLQCAVNGFFDNLDLTIIPFFISGINLFMKNFLISNYFLDDENNLNEIFEIKHIIFFVLNLFLIQCSDK